MRRNLGFGGLLVGIAVALAAAGCGGSSDESPTTAPAGTAPPTTLAPSTAEQVCGLLLDREVASVVSVDVTPVPGASNEPRACTWVTGDEPGRPVLRLSLESQQWLEPSDTAPSSEGLGAPCESGSRVGTVETDSDDRLYATCLVDGLAVSLYKSGTEPLRLRRTAGSGRVSSGPD